MIRRQEGKYNRAMALEPRYTDDHAAAGLDFAFPAIETWKNQFPGYEILIDDPELTSVCPKTGLPDFGVLTIRYMPRERCLELKSLKEYLFSYRNLGIFQENIVNQVLEDVVKATDPVWAEVKGVFRPRGGNWDDGRCAVPANDRDQWIVIRKARVRLARTVRSQGCTP